MIRIVATIIKLQLTVPFLESNSHIASLSGISIWRHVRWNYQKHENFSALFPRSHWVATGDTMTVNAMRYIIYLIGECIFFTCSRLFSDHGGTTFKRYQWLIFQQPHYLIYWLQFAPYFIFQSLSTFGCNSAQCDLLYMLNM